MSDDLVLEIPGPVECPNRDSEIDLEDDECRFLIIVICPKCNIAFQYEEEPHYH